MEQYLSLIRASDDALVDTVTTGDTGTVFAPLTEGDYYALEQEFRCSSTTCSS